MLTLHAGSTYMSRSLGHRARFKHWLAKRLWAI